MQRGVGTCLGGQRAPNPASIRTSGSNRRSLLFQAGGSHLVSDYGFHELGDVEEARAEAIELAHSVCEARPGLIGKHGPISVTDEEGAGVCLVPIDMLV
jgi:hypothetical protein